MLHHALSIHLANSIAMPSPAFGMKGASMLILLCSTLQPPPKRENDPTVERCERRARALGFGQFTVTNIFAYRATDPKEMRASLDPIGHDNDREIEKHAIMADQIICAWGTHGAFLERGASVEARLRECHLPLYSLGLSKEGHPKHPLYIGYKEQPRLWEQQ